MIEIIYRMQHKLDSYLKSKSYSQLFFIFFISQFTFATISSILAAIADPNLSSNPIDKENIFFSFAMLVIVAPVMETLIFQIAIIEIGSEFKLPRKLLVLLSAILFGIAHHFNWVYVAVTFGMGGILAYSYVFVRNKYDIAKATLFVVSLHAGSNFIAFLNNNVFHFI